MNDLFPDTLASALHKQHDIALNATLNLTAEQLHWKPTPASVSIQFHLWHLARWADLFHAMYQEFIAGGNEGQGPAGQIWEAEQIAQQWGLDYSGADRFLSGTHMEAESAANLKLPIEELFDYTRRTFAASEQAMAELERSHDLTRSVVVFEFILNIRGLLIHQLQHTGRHVGMIEALRSLVQQEDTATQ
jgi:hypothetical protein